MNAEIALKLARRFIELPQDKRPLFLDGLREEGVEFSLLPIPDGVVSEDRDELSYAQRRMWFLWQLDPQGAAYNLPMAVRLSGPLDRAAFEAAFASLVQRHETLRTVFPQRADGTPRQAALERPVPIDFEDLSLLPEAERETCLRETAQAESLRPFDLCEGPLLRVRLIRLGEEQHVLLLTLHHIVSDGWSMNVLIEEFSRFYKACMDNSEAGLPPLPIQYSDYALWQRSWMEAGEQERQLAYWRERLGDQHPLLELPTDHPRPAQASYRGTRYEFEIDPALVQALRASARSQGLTLFMLLLGGFNILLQRYSGQSDLRVGVPIANRNRAEVEGLIGLFVNTQVLRSVVEGQATVASLLASLKDSVLGAQAHQELPFERLVEAFKIERSLSHSPLFQVMYNHQPQVADIGSLDDVAGLRFAPLDWKSRTTQFDLSLDTYEKGGRLHAALTYATDLFEAETIERMARHWQNLLRAMLVAPAARIDTLPMLEADERRQMLETWNATAANYPLETCVHRLFEHQVQRSPEAPALVFGEQRLSYGELNRRANRLAHALIARGVGAESLIGVAMERSVELVIALMGILKAGGAYVPLDPEYPQERLSYMLEDSGVRLLLTQAHLLDGLPVSAEVQPLVLAADSERLEGFDASDPEVAVTGENLAYVIYTSGSTGRPKGAGNRHSALTNRLCWMQDAYQLDGSDAVMQKTPFSFDVSVWEFFWPLMVGARLVLAQPGDHRDPSRLMDLIGRESISTLHFVPSMLQAFLQAPGVSACTSLKRIVCSGEALPVDAQQRVLAELPGVRLYNLYGPTEAAIDVTHWDCREEGRDTVPIGRPIANLRCYVLDDALEPVPVGALGELYLAGAGLARGYHLRPALSAERFLADPFATGERMYRTGDLARYRADGVIEYAGRIDHQVKLRGLRIELGEIETRLLEHHAVREAAVLVVDGKQLVGYVTLAAEPDEWRGMLSAHLAESLPEYMVPMQWVALERMPLSPNGKLDRKALPRPDATLGQVVYSMPRSPAERCLAEIWEALLGIERVGLDDNFFALGGDSIVSIQMVGRARQAGFGLSPRDLFQHQTIRGLAQVAVPCDSAVIQAPVGGEVALTPVQHWFFGLDIPNRRHWNQSLLLKARESVDGERLEQALLALIRQHDALRLRFHEEEGCWRQEYSGEVESPLWRRQVASVEELSALCEEAQRSLDLSTGPLLRALLVELPEGEQRLLLVIHHLVVDGVSWRILLEDLQQFYQSSDSPAVLRTHSYQAWSAHLREVAGKRHDELAFWQTHLDGAPADLPCQNPHAPLENRHARKLALTLDAEATRRLLQEAPAAYRTQVIDLLLTALARVVCNWSGHESLLLQLEGHGREELGGELDLSRTVGWFTSLYPVHLHPAVEPGAAIKSVKEQLRSIPDRGIGYGLLRYLADPACGEVLARSPQPRITFNYLGQFDHQFADEALWVPAAERSGSAQDERAPLANWLSVEGQVYQGQLGLTWTFSPDMFSDETVQELVDAFAADLNGLIEHCCDPASGGVTPSDFPLAGLDQAQLDALSLPYGEIEDIYPLTPMQEGLLLHTLMEPNSGIYFMQDRYVIDSDIDMPRFEAAWREVARRHDALRASFHVDDSGQMRQIIHREAKLKVFFDDWSGRPEEEHEEALAELLAEDRRRGFDLLRTPPFFLRVIRRAPGRHWFVLSNHHILIDAWCRSLLLQDFFLLYSRKQVLPPAPRYRDFIEWLQTQGERAALEAWRKELEGFEQPTPLPFDRPVHRQGGTSIIGDRYANLAPEQGRRLRELAQQHHLTVNTLAQAAWALVLRRYSGLHDVLFGVTVAGRPVSRPEMQNTVGLFINSIALRVRLPGGDSRLTVREWLQGLFQQNLELREHEHLSLVQIQACSALEKGQRMFDSLFVYENAPVESKLFSSAEELQARSDTARTHTNYPLTVVVYPGDDLGLHLSYDERYFDEETVDRLLTDFKRLLLAIGDGFHDAFTELPLVPEEEYAALLHSPAGRRAYPFDEGYVRLFEAQVDRLGERVAATCRDRAWSYRQLDAEANRVAWGLLEAGVERDRAVALLADRGLELMAMMIGTFKAGAAYLPLDPSLPRSRLVNLLKLGGVPALVVGEGHQALARELLEELPEESRPALLDWAAQQGQGKCEQRPGIVAPTNGLAYVIYTSGSTGHPKGVMVEQAGMLNNQLSKVPLLALDENDVIAQTASQSFDISVWQFLAAPLFGAQVDILPNDIAHDPLALSRRVRERGITVLELVPSLIQEVLDDPQETLPGLRWMLSTGEALSPELARRWLTRYPQVGLMNAYGPAECSDDVSFFRVDTQSTGGTYLPIGQATDNNHLQVLDDDLLPVPLGGIGELYVSGTGVGRGYLADPGRTALAFLPDPYAQVPGSRIYRTGDLACRGKGDQLEYVGRIDHQVKVRGFRIELGEIESRLLELPIVREAVVLAQDGPTGKSLAAYLVPAESDTPLVALRDECRAALKGQLPEYMLPSLWRSLDSLPLNPNGKIDRKALPPIEDSQDQSHFVAPHEGLERSLAEIWAEVLKVERVGRDDNFFELGGHSLLVTQVLSRIRRRLGLELPLAALFEHANLADFAAYAKSAGGTLQTPLRRMDRGAASPLSYAQQRQWFLWQLEPDSAAYHIPAALRLCGELDVEALKRSFAALVERHEGLRTTFRQEGGETLQVVHDRLPLEIREQSLGVADEAALMARIEEEVRVPFDLERGPLLRVLLLRLSAEEQVLVVTLHHIVSDGWSTPIMVEELMQFYAGYREGRAVELEPLPIQYADYALWQRSWMEAGERERQLVYWRQQLGGEQPVLELPTDRPRPSVQSPAGDSLQVELGEDLGRSLKQLAQQQGVTLFMLLLASFQTLLHRYSGQPEIRVGVPIANRTRVETERLIGFFVNTQVLKADFDLETRFDVLLQQVKRTALEAQAHQDLPFEQLVEALQPQRSLSHSPLFQVMYNHQNAGQGKALELPGLRVEALERASATAQFDLTLDTYESGDALSASLIYATSLFERSTVERLAAHWRNLLEAICREPARRVGELPLLDRSERDLLL
ncbi:TPA: amino acid adenylation domain-containing protein, partial [Pseudomonas aeruginosa]